MLKKIVAICLTVLMPFMFTFTGVMAEEQPTTHELFLAASQQIENAAKEQGLVIGKEYEYTYPDGQVQTYYLDEGYNPYCLDSNGGKIFLALPLEHLIIKDQRLLEVIQNGLPTNLSELENSDGVLRGAPTNYHDLTNPYEIDMDFSGERLYQPMLKVPMNYPTIDFSFSNLRPWPYHKVFIVYTMYDNVTGSSVASGMLRGNDGKGIDCNGINRIGGITTASRYVGLTIGRADELETCHMKIIKWAGHI